MKDILAAFERKYRVNARQEIVAGVPARWQEPGGNAELRIGSVNEFSPRRWRWRDGIRIEVVTGRLEAAIVVTDFQLDPLRNQAWRYGIIIMHASSMRMLYFLQNLFREMNSACFCECSVFWNEIFFLDKRSLWRQFFVDLWKWLFFVLRTVFKEDEVSKGR